MPRKYSQDWSAGDDITSQRLQDVNQELDDILANGSDRLRVFEAASGTALRVDIGAGNYYIGSTIGLYAGTTDMVVTDNATNYIMIDVTGTIQTSTSARNDAYARLAKVTTSG